MCSAVRNIGTPLRQACRSKYIERDAERPFQLHRLYVAWLTRIVCSLPSTSRVAPSALDVRFVRERVQ